MLRQVFSGDNNCIDRCSQSERRNPPVRSGIFFCVLTRLTVVYADDNSSRLDEIATEHSSCAEDTPAWTAWRAGQIDPIAVGTVKANEYRSFSASNLAERVGDS